MPVECGVDLAIEGLSHIRRAEWDRAIAVIAARQHGLVQRSQLLALGLSESAIEHRLRTGRLHLIHRGVYAVGHPNLTREGRWLAGVYSVGPDAALSHRSGTELWELETYAFHRVEVTAPRYRDPGPGVLAHRCRLSPAETTIRSGIPVTTPLRTVLDLAAVAGTVQVARAFRSCEAKRLVTAEQLAAAVEARTGRRGNMTLRAVLAEAGYGHGISRSELERAFTAFLRRQRLPAPGRNVKISIGPIEVEADAVWPRARLIVELDSRTFHDTASAFERDRERDRALAVHGWRVVRITWRQLHRDATQLARDLEALLAVAAV